MGEPGGLPSVGVTQSRTRLKRLSSSKHGEGGKNGDYLFKKLCCLGVGFVQSELSQKEKNKYHILTHVSGI